MTDRATLVRRLDHVSEDGDSLITTIRQWLLRADTRLVSDRVAKVTVAEARRLWSTRLENTHLTGQPIQGAETLLARLQELAPQRKLEQIALVGPDNAGSLFFAGNNHHFVGAILVKSRTS